MELNKPFINFGTTDTHSLGDDAVTMIAGSILGLGAMISVVVLFSIWYLYKRRDWPATKRLLAMLRKRRHTRDKSETRP